MSFEHFLHNVQKGQDAILVYGILYIRYVDYIPTGCVRFLTIIVGK